MQLVAESLSREEQLAFNRLRWAEICDDPDFANLPGKIESNALGQVLLMPLASGNHSFRTRAIQRALEDSIGGIALPECPISTIDGVRAADVGWYSNSRFSKVNGQIAFEIAPEICVEILSPRNTRLEMNVKKRLYFDAGAQEVWICDLAGNLTFYRAEAPEDASETSGLCPGFPKTS